jgi:hypothetical protein
MTDNDDFTSMYDVLDALEAAIGASDPEKRESLADAIDGYSETFPEDFHWATGGQSPTLLSNLLMAIDCSCRPDAQSKPRPAIRLVDRKPHSPRD